MRRGEIRWALLPEPWGRRPVLLLARNEAYSLLTWVVVAPLTTRLRVAPSIVSLDPERDNVPRPSAVQVDHLQSVPATSLGDVIANLSPEKMAEVDRAVHFALALRNCL